MGAGPWQVEAVWRWEAATKSPRSLHGAGFWCCWMQTEASCRFPWVPLGFHPVFFSLVNICCDAGPGWQQCFWSPSPCKRLKALGAHPVLGSWPSTAPSWATSSRCGVDPGSPGHPVPAASAPAAPCNLLQPPAPSLPRRKFLPGLPFNRAGWHQQQQQQGGRRRCCPRDPKHCSGALGGTSYVPGVAAVTPGRAIPSPWVPGCPWSCGCKAGVSRGLLPRAGSPAAREAGHQCEAAPGPSG